MKLVTVKSLIILSVSKFVEIQTVIRSWWEHEMFVIQLKAHIPYCSAFLHRNHKTLVLTANSMNMLVYSRSNTTQE